MRSLYELVRQVKDLSFWVVTRNVDYTQTVSLPVSSDRWVELFPNTRVKYLSRWTPSQVIRAIRESVPDIVYINSFFSPWFSVVPLWLLAGRLPLVLAPRGMLMPRMLAIKRWRKRAYLTLFMLRGLHKRVLFHATSTAEAREISRLFGESISLRVLPNVVSPPGVCLSFSSFVEPCGRLNLIYVGRIAPEKNLIVLLRALRHIEGRVHLTICGSVYDRHYWLRCQHLIEELHHTKNNISVVWGGAVPFWKLGEVLIRHHAVVVPSLSESFGHVIYDALVAGMPVVLSSGCAHWQTPFVFSPDSEIQLAEHLNRLASLTSEEYLRLCRQSHAQAVAWWQREGVHLPEQYRRMFADASEVG